MRIERPPSMGVSTGSGGGGGILLTVLFPKGSVGVLVFPNGSLV